MEIRCHRQRKYLTPEQYGRLNSVPFESAQVGLVDQLVEFELVGRSRL